MRSEVRAALQNWRGDLFGGITAAIVALPLALALGVLSGAGAMAGLYSAVFIGTLAALFGGAPAQISGPTAGMTVILLPVFQEFGRDGLFMAMFLGGLLMIGLSFLRVGRYVHLISGPVLSGFTNGIAILIFTQQVGGLRTAAGAVDIHAALLVAGVIGVMLLWPRITRKVPGSLIALLGGTLAVHLFWPGSVPLLGDIPGGWPTLQLGFIGSQWGNLIPLLKPAIVICLLGAIESLLASVVVDDMAGTKHQSDREIFGQGIGNTAATLFGGIAGTGAIVRSAANVQAGGRGRLSGVVHGVVILLVAVGLGQYAALIPRAVLAGILMATAINMVDRRSLADLRRAPFADSGIMLATAFLTVAVDLVSAVAIGVLLSMVRFALSMALVPLQVKRMGAVSVINLEGPLFFGIARRFLDAVEATPTGSTLIVDLRKVTSLDATGVTALEKAHRIAAEQGCNLVWSGVQPQVRQVLQRLDRLPFELLEATP